MIAMGAYLIVLAVLLNLAASYPVFMWVLLFFGAGMASAITVILGGLWWATKSD